MFGCCCNNGTIRSVISLTPYNFYQKFKPGAVSNPSGISTSETIGQPDLSNNTSKFLRRIVSVNLFGGSLTGILDTEYNRQTGEETTNQDDSVPGGNQMGWYLTYAGIVGAGYYVTNTTSTDRSVTMEIWDVVMGVPQQIGFSTIQYYDEVTYFMASDDADGLLANVTLLANGYTVIDPTTLRTLGALTPAATTYSFTGNSIVVSPPTLAVGIGKTIFVNWPNSNPYQLIGNVGQSYALLPWLTSGKQRSVAARGLPGFIYNSGFYDERFFRWPPATTGQAKVYEPQKNGYYDQANNLQKVDFVVAMKSAHTFAEIQEFVIAAYDPNTNLFSSGAFAKTIPPLGQIVFDPTDLGAAFGTLAVAWDMPTNNPQQNL